MVFDKTDSYNGQTDCCKYKAIQVYGTSSILRIGCGSRVGAFSKADIVDFTISRIGDKNHHLQSWFESVFKSQDCCKQLTTWWILHYILNIYVKLCSLIQEKYCEVLKCCKHNNDTFFIQCFDIKFYFVNFVKCS